MKITITRKTKRLDKGKNNQPFFAVTSNGQGGHPPRRGRFNLMKAPLEL